MQLTTFLINLGNSQQEQINQILEIRKSPVKQQHQQHNLTQFNGHQQSSNSDISHELMRDRIADPLPVSMQYNKGLIR